MPAQEGSGRTVYYDLNTYELGVPLSSLPECKVGPFFIPLLKWMKRLQQHDVLSMLRRPQCCIS